jgi:hypothetical protein
MKRFPLIVYFFCQLYFSFSDLSKYPIAPFPPNYEHCNCNDLTIYLVGLRVKNYMLHLNVWVGNAIELWSSEKSKCYLSVNIQSHFTFIEQVIYRLCILLAQGTNVYHIPPSSYQIFYCKYLILRSQPNEELYSRWYF